MPYIITMYNLIVRSDQCLLYEGLEFRSYCLGDQESDLEWMKLQLAKNIADFN